MKMIKKLVHQIDEELEGAQCYAETYVEYKVKGDSQWANRYKEMAVDELKHAMYIHECAVNKIKALNEVITPPEEMLEKWEEAHTHYVERAAWIKQMLTL